MQEAEKQELQVKIENLQQEIKTMAGQVETFSACSVNLQILGLNQHSQSVRRSSCLQIEETRMGVSVAERETAVKAAQVQKRFRITSFRVRFFFILQQSI